MVIFKLTELKAAQIDCLLWACSLDSTIESCTIKALMILSGSEILSADRHASKLNSHRQKSKARTNIPNQRDLSPKVQTAFI
jgi:hypothetical protein